MKLYGSVNNRFEEGATFVKPAVGVGVTEYLWSDRNPFEIVDVIDEKHLIIRECDYKRIDDNGMSESQEYEYTLKPYKEWIDEYTGEKRNNNQKIVLTKYGWRERLHNGKLGSSKFSIGKKERYYDFSF